MARAMRASGGLLPDRTPVMCQLALGHYFLHAGAAPVTVWHDGETFASALVTLQRRYGFDGILVNLPGRPPDWRRLVDRVEPGEAGSVVVFWRGGERYSVVPVDDNVHVHLASGAAPSVPLSEVDPERLFYVEPHDIAGPTYPTRWALDVSPAEPGPSFFPPWHWDTLATVRRLAPEVSVHGEVFSPFTQMMELLGYADGLMAMMLEPDKFKACLDRLADGTVELAAGHARVGADAVLISSAFAGAGFLSPAHYREFVLPFERTVIQRLGRRCPDIPVYTHTCGAIGDRLELMLETGTNGIDTLDPPPLGTVDLADAKRRLGQRAFIKGNIDPVNTMLRGSPAEVFDDARRRIGIAAQGGGHILSTACSVAPHTPAENILQLARAAVSAASGDQGSS